MREHKIIKISQIINFEIKSLSEEIKPMFFKHMLENMKFATWDENGISLSLIDLMLKLCIVNNIFVSGWSE